MWRLLAIFLAPFLLTMSIGINQYVIADTKTKVLRVAGDESLPPFSYINNEGEWTGFSIEILQAIEEVEQMEIEYIPMDFYKAIAALNAGQVDALIGMKYTAKRKDYFAFSESYFTMSEAIVVPEGNDEIQDLSDLKGKVAAIQSGHVAFDLLQDVRRVQMNIAQSQPDALHLLMMGRADAFIGNRWTAQFYLNESKNEQDYRIIESPIQPADYAFVVKKENDEVLDLLNNGLLTIKANGTYDQIYSDWFNIKYVQIIEQMKSVVFILIWVLSIVGIVLVMGLFWNKRLKKEVKNQTSALKEANLILEINRQEIENQGAFKEQILNNVPNGIVTFDHDWNVTLINEEARKLLFYKDRLHDHVIIQEAIQLYKSKDEDQISGAVKFEQGNDVFFVAYHLRLLLNAQNQKNGFLLIFANRTEEKRLQEKLATQEKMRALGQLSAGVAHEMRNPLTSIKTFIELLPKKYDNPSFRKAINEHVPAEIDRLNLIIEDLLDYSRPKDPKKHLFCVKEWLDSIIVLFEPTLRGKQIDFQTEVESEIMIYADQQQLKQVIVNMILNAIDAMEHGVKKEIKLCAHTINNETQILVQDTGIGMKKEEMEKCFDPFYTTKADGVGLGMTISFKILKENGGDIEITSQYGEGTTFRLTFPQSTIKGDQYV